MTPYQFTDADYTAIVKAARDPKADWREDFDNPLIETLTLELNTPRATISLTRNINGVDTWGGSDDYGRREYLFEVTGETYEVTSVEAFDKDDNDIPHDFDNSRLVGMLNCGLRPRRAA